jgi:hypothetical protein
MTGAWIRHRRRPRSEMGAAGEHAVGCGLGGHRAAYDLTAEGHAPMLASRREKGGAGRQTRGRALKVHANCISGQARSASQRISDALDRDHRHAAYRRETGPSGRHVAGRPAHGWLRAIRNARRCIRKLSVLAVTRQDQGTAWDA